MNIKIFHQPLKQKVVFLPFDNLDNAVMPFYTIQKREIGHECFLLNSYDLATILAEKESDIEDLEQKLPNYCIVLNLWGGQFFPEERIAYEEKAVAEITKEYTCSTCEALASISDASSRFENMLTSPWEGDVYWKERQMGGCLEVVFESGLDKVPSYWKLFQQMAGEYNLDTHHLGLYIQPRQRARVCHVEFHIPCDPGNPSKLDNAKAFHKKVSEAIMNAGAFFYRPYYDWANIIYPRSGYTFETIKRLKKILDPNRVLNPGRLNL